MRAVWEKSSPPRAKGKSAKGNLCAKCSRPRKFFLPEQFNSGLPKEFWLLRFSRTRPTGSELADGQPAVPAEEEAEAADQPVVTRSSYIAYSAVLGCLPYLSENALFYWSCAIGRADTTAVWPSAGMLRFLGRRPCD